MSAPRRGPLCMAIASAGMFGVAGGASAVNLSASGFGQVLLYPYYTTRADGAGNAYATVLSVANATGSAKAVKVRILEGRNGKLVFTFNLFLSPFDTWAATLTKDAKIGARIGTPDRSCTLPAFATAQSSGYFALSNHYYTGSNDDGAGTSLDRAREGRIEIIEMASYAPSSTTGIAVTHVSGVPPCGSNLSDAQAAADAQAPTGGLFGSATLINVNSSAEYTANPFALDNFTVLATYQGAASALPDLAQAFPPVSRVVAPNGAMYSSTWTAGTADPVSAVLMHNSQLNEYIIDTATKAGTDWVVTMPTKRYYVQRGTGNAMPPFQRNFNGTNGACDDLTLNIYDREERTVTLPLTFSPPPPTSTNAICWEANVITFNNTNVLGSTNLANIPFLFQNGFFLRTVCQKKPFWNASIVRTRKVWREPENSPALRNPRNTMGDTRMAVMPLRRCAHTVARSHSSR